LDRNINPLATTTDCRKVSTLPPSHVNSHPIVVHPFTVPIHLGWFQWEVSGFGIAVLLSFVIAQIVSLLPTAHVSAPVAV
jgi:hypothetical protein